MSLQGPIPVEFGTVFPRGAFAAGAFDPVRDFDASKDGRFVQSKDKATGPPLWVIEVIDPDPEARDRTVKVKVAAPVQPVIRHRPAGLPFVPVEFTGMTVTPYVNQAGRLAYSLQGDRAVAGRAAAAGAAACAALRQRAAEQYARIERRAGGRGGGGARHAATPAAPGVSPGLQPEREA